MQLSENRDGAVEALLLNTFDLTKRKLWGRRSNLEPPAPRNSGLLTATGELTTKRQPTT